MSAWICERCGRPNDGDACPGCGEHKPFTAMVKVSESVGRAGNRTVIQDGSKPPTTFDSHSVWLFIVLLGILLYFVLPGGWSFILAECVVGIFLAFRFLLVPQRIALMKFLSRRKRRALK